MSIVVELAYPKDMVTQIAVAALKPNCISDNHLNFM
jgi:hypothetical protein